MINVEKKCDSKILRKPINDSSLNIESDLEVDSNSDSSFKNLCSSREDQLEELLNGLKKKFASLPKNDPLRISILTIAPDCWSMRQIATEFNISIRQAAKTRQLKEAKGILAEVDPKTGKNLPDETIQKVIKFYESDENSRGMPNKKPLSIYWHFASCK